MINNDARAPSAPAYLVIFDRRAAAGQKFWEERLSWENEGGVTIIGV